MAKKRTVDPLEHFAGTHPDILSLKKTARAYALSDSPVLISGETGTGKEVLARAMHHLSHRAAGPFIPINCSAFSSQLVESELFGHEAGSFTGANTSRAGFLKQADGGTLFLDEVGDLPLEIQPKMLRFLQFGTFYPIGSEKEHRVDLRIISATNRPLAPATTTQKTRSSLRRDVLYRLNVLHLHVPPLRERAGDIPLILRKLAERRR